MRNPASPVLLAAALVAGPVVALAQAPAVTAQTSSGFIKDATSDAARSSLGDRLYATNPAQNDRPGAAQAGDRGADQAREPSAGNADGNTANRPIQLLPADRPQTGRSDRPGS